MRLDVKSDLKHRLQQALRNRQKVYARITKVVFIGPAGAGKSHLLSALVEEDPEVYRNSTPCAKRGVRAIAKHRVLVGKKSSWKLLKAGEFESMVVNKIHKSTPVKVSDAQAPISGPAAQPRVPVDFEELLEQLSVKSTDTSYSLEEDHCFIFVDTGGQPRYHEILRAFVRNASLNLVVIKLIDELDEVASSEFYKDGEMICQFGTYNLTNRQLIVRLLHAAQLCHNTSGVLGPLPTHPACFLVGTHKDREDECGESYAVKNKKLSKTLQPYKDVIHPKKSRQHGANEWIFPVNARPPFTEDQKQLLQDLRDCIMECSETYSPTVPLAMGWYALELRMEQLRERGLRVISLAQCQKIAEAFSFPSKDDLLLCLEYLNELGLIIYFPDVLPEILFIDPQLLLDMVSELIASCCRLQADDAKYRLPHTCSAKEIEEFRDRGIFSVDMLEKCFSTHYVEGLFTVRNFVDVLTHLLMAAPLDEAHTRYFMPSLLESSTSDIQLSTAPGHTCFLLRLESCPFGLFCAVITYMLSSQTEPCLSFTDEKVQRCSENCVVFEAVDYACTITLINNDSFLCLEVYVDMQNLSDGEASELCPLLRTKVVEAIGEAASKHHYDICTGYAFYCSSECTVTQPHIALVARDGKQLVCKETKKKFPLSKKQKYWIQIPSELQAPHSGRETGQYQRIFSRLDQLINHLSVYVAAESLADKLLRDSLITRDIHDEACVAAVTNSMRIRKLIFPVLSKIELNVKNYDKFVAILNEFRGLEDFVTHMFGMTQLNDLPGQLHQESSKVQRGRHSSSGHHQLGNLGRRVIGGGATHSREYEFQSSQWRSGEQWQGTPPYQFQPQGPIPQTRVQDSIPQARVGTNDPIQWSHVSNWPPMNPTHDQLTHTGSQSTGGQRVSQMVNVAQPVTTGMNMAPPVLTGMNVGQPMATGMNVGQPMARSMNVGQLMATGMNVGQPIARSMNVGQLMATGMNSRQPMATGMNLGQPVPTGMNVGQPMATGMNSGQPVPTGMNSGQPMATGMNSGQPMATGMNSGQPVPTGMNSGQPVPTGMNSGQPMPTGMNMGQPLPMDMAYMPPGMIPGVGIGHQPLQPHHESHWTQQPRPRYDWHHYPTPRHWGGH